MELINNNNTNILSNQPFKLAHVTENGTMGHEKTVIVLSSVVLDAYSGNY